MNYDQLGVPRVINAAGRLTALGGAALSAEVLEAMTAAGRSNVDMETLKRQAGKLIARLTGAEDAMVTTGAAAGICIMAAAVVAGTNPARVRALPDADWPKRNVLVQAGHAVHFGGSVTQMLRLGGARPVLVGDANHVTAAELEATVDEHTAGFMYVQSHHTVQKGMVSLAQCITICHRHGVPVLVDAAAEEDLAKYLTLGADLVTYSGGKAFGGPTSGFVAGRAELVEACRAQEGGIARGMKVGKETIMGLAVALDRYSNADQGLERARQAALVEGLEAGLAGLPHTRLSRLEDEAGRAIIRLGLTLEAGPLGFTAEDLLKGLLEGSPAVVLRGHWVNTGTVAIDPRPIEQDDLPAIIAKIRGFYAGKGHRV